MSNDFIVRCGSFYFERWGSVEGDSAPVMTILRAAAHRTDREAAEMIVAMLGYGHWLAEIKPTEQKENPAEKRD
jgi:hypothetical protein